MVFLTVRGILKYHLLLLVLHVTEGAWIWTLHLNGVRLKKSIFIFGMPLKRSNRIEKSGGARAAVSMPWGGAGARAQCSRWGLLLLNPTCASPAHCLHGFLHLFAWRALPSMLTAAQHHWGKEYDAQRQSAGGCVLCACTSQCSWGEGMLVLQTTEHKQWGSLLVGESGGCIGSGAER